MAAEKIRRRLVVHGNVQGVFYRDSIRHAARDQSVSGWAANRSDGSVEVVLEGPADAVQSVVAYCHQGPASADVHSVDEHEETPEGLTGFQIR
ncbi:MAG TPA: acylphosphatase [Solirubrobacteraceae bacterium]|jgi:acylphosphatase|nr:acylphosphatase [Solirubrobacteraceae bacterium]